MYGPLRTIVIYKGNFITNLTTGSKIGNEVAFVDYYGSQWAVHNMTALSLNQSDKIVVGQSTPNADDYDNIVPSAINLTITPTTGPELRAALSSVTLVSPSGETEVQYGYTSMGSFLKFTS